MKQKSNSPEVNSSKWIFFLFIATLSCISFTTVSAHDLGWHLKTGEWILEYLKIPSVDIYSPNPQDIAWYDFHWFFQLISYFIFETGGFLGLNGLKILVLALSYYFTASAIRRKGVSLLGAFIFLLSVLASQERFQFRPELFTFLFMAIDLFILEKEYTKPTKLLWLIPTVQIFWTNMEGLFMIGPFLVGAYLIGNLLERGKTYRLLFTLAITILASLINPYGWKGFLFPFTLLKEISIKTEGPSIFIGEFLSPLSGNINSFSIIFFYLLIILCFGVIVKSFKKVPRAHIILFCVFLTLAMMAQRNIALFALVAPIIILKNWNQFYLGKSEAPRTYVRGFLYLLALERQSPERYPRSHLRGLPRSGIHFLKWPAQIGYILICLLLMGASISNHLYVKNSRLERFGIGIAPEIFPQNAITYLLKNHPNEKLFNSIELGPSLIYLGWPRLTPWIDTRLEVCGIKKLEEYKYALQNESKWEELVQKNHTGTVLLDHIQKDSLELISYLSKHPDWALVYYDEIAVIFLKTALKPNPIQGKISTQKSFYTYLKKYFPWLPEEAVFPLESIYLARLYMALENDSEARKFYRQALSISKHWTEGWINLAYLEEREGKLDEAARLLKEALKNDHDSYQAHFNLGNIYLKTSQYHEAVQQFKKAIKINPTVRAKHNLSVAEERLKN